MRTFHDVIIYSGTTEVTTSSRLEIASKSGFLAEIFSEQKECDGCKEATVLIFPEEDPTTLKEAFDLLSHFKSSFSIIQSKPKISKKHINENIIYFTFFRSSQSQHDAV